MWTTGSRLCIGAAVVSFVIGLGILPEPDLIGAAIVQFALGALFVGAAVCCMATRDFMSLTSASRDRENRCASTTVGHQDTPLGSVAPLLVAIAMVIGALAVVLDLRWLVLAIGIGGLAAADWIVTAHIDTLDDGIALRRRLRRRMLLPATVVLTTAAAAAVALPLIWSLVRRSDTAGQILITVAVVAAAVMAVRDLRRGRRFSASSLRMIASLIPTAVIAYLVL